MGKFGTKTPIPEYYREYWSFEGCEYRYRPAFFCDNLTYIFFDTYIATILYKWACLADEEQPEENNKAKIKPEKADVSNVEMKANSVN